MAPRTRAHHSTAQHNFHANATHGHPRAKRTARGHNVAAVTGRECVGTPGELRNRVGGAQLACRGLLRAVALPPAYVPRNSGIHGKDCLLDPQGETTRCRLHLSRAAAGSGFGATTFAVGLEIPGLEMLGLMPVW